MANTPWKNTKIKNDQYLDLLNIRPVPSSDNDKLYEIEQQYMYRPDLLAYDLYNDKDLWWVFAQRNINIIKDPIYDFVPGIKIFLPQANLIKKLLG